MRAVQQWQAAVVRAATGAATAAAEEQSTWQGFSEQDG
jgi:hypothetical protein